MPENNENGQNGLTAAPQQELRPVRYVKKKKLSRREKLVLYAKRFFAQFGTALLAAAIVGYVFLQLMLNVGTMVEVESAAYASISQKAELTAYLFRDEHVIPAGESGTACFLVSDGEKVMKGADIAVTYTESDDAARQRRINDIDARIEVLNKSSVNEGASTTNVSLIDESIARVTLAMIRDVDGNALDKAMRERDELMVLLNRRHSLVHSVSYTAELSRLYSERNELVNAMHGESYVTRSPESGYFYSSVDGYENVFTSAAMEALTAESFEMLSESVPDRALIAGSSGKIVDNSTWYIAVSLDKRSAEQFRVGSEYPITFQYSNGIVLDMCVHRRVSRTDTDDTIVVFSTKAMPEGFDYSRCQTVELTKAEYAGLRISASAIRVNNGETGVYVVLGNRVAFKKTEVIYSYAGYCICRIPLNPDYPNSADIAYNSRTELSLHDTVITEGSGIYDGMRLT